DANPAVTAAPEDRGPSEGTWTRTLRALRAAAEQEAHSEGPDSAAWQVRVETLDRLIAEGPPAGEDSAVSLAAVLELLAEPVDTGQTEAPANGPAAMPTEPSLT